MYRRTAVSKKQKDTLNEKIIKMKSTFNAQIEDLNHQFNVSNAQAAVIKNCTTSLSAVKNTMESCRVKTRQLEQELNSTNVQHTDVVNRHQLDMHELLVNYTSLKHDYQMLKERFDQVSALHKDAVVETNIWKNAHNDCRSNNTKVFKSTLNSINKNFKAHKNTIRKCNLNLDKCRSLQSIFKKLDSNSNYFKHVMQNVTKSHRHCIDLSLIHMKNITQLSDTNRYLNMQLRNFHYRGEVIKQLNANLTRAQVMIEGYQKDKTSLVHQILEFKKKEEGHREVRQECDNRVGTYINTNEQLNKALTNALKESKDLTATLSLLKKGQAEDFKKEIMACHLKLNDTIRVGEKCTEAREKDNQIYLAKLSTIYHEQNHKAEMFKRDLIHKESELKSSQKVCDTEIAMCRQILDALSIEVESLKATHPRYKHLIEENRVKAESTSVKPNTADKSLPKPKPNITGKPLPKPNTSKNPDPAAGKSRPEPNTSVNPVAKPLPKPNTHSSSAAKPLPKAIEHLMPPNFTKH